MNQTWSVALISLGTAVATGLGALPFFFTKKLSVKWLSIGNAVAAGCMVGATVLLGWSGYHSKPSSMWIGAVIGALFIVLAQRILKKLPSVSIHNIAEADARKILLIVIVMTVHSLSEGVGIGVAFGNGTSFGLLIALALAIHNIPEGLAISLVLYPRGISAWKTAGWSVFSSLPQLLAVPAYIFVEHFHPYLPYGLGFAAGAMIWLALTELLPDALKEGSKQSVAIFFILSTAVMILLERYI